MTVGEKYRECIKALEGHSDSPALDVSLFFQDICLLSKSALILHSSDSLDPEKERKIDKFISLRLKGDPVAYILGHKGFYKSEFYTPRNVLVPQPDTEILVENTIRAASSFSPSIRILDVCAGTGCVGISSALEISGFSDVELTLSDISEDAFSAFSQNASKLLPPSVKVKLLLSDLFDGVKGQKFHIIASNPPYIRSSVIESLPPEVQAEPRLALDGGEDGLALICKMVSQAPDYLEDGGYLLLETGYDQGEDVKKIMKERGFASVEIKKDLGGRDRVVLGHM